MIAVAAGVVIVVTAVGGAIATGQSPPTFWRGPGTITHVEQRADGPHTITEVDLTALPTPHTYGPFLIGARSASNDYATPAAGEPQHVDDAIIRADALYPRSQILTVFPGAEESLGLVNRGGVILEVRASYKVAYGGGSRGIEIVRWRPRLPVVVAGVAPGGFVELEQSTVAGAPALFYKAKAVLDSYAQNSIYFMRDGVLTQIGGMVPFDTLMKIAESVQ
ncbi:MAG: hypothetical protein ACYDEB_12310 [Dehalococcoidia bacterium]